MIRRLLVANRGEIARRIFATCRAMGVETVAVASDADAGSPHAREADLAVRLPGSSPAETYLRADLIVAAAQRSGADAVHPGYGFGSENAEFAEAVLDAGLIWVGPPAKAIAAMGSKLDAKALLTEAGVPILPSWTEPEQVTQFPVLVKASAGGGGRGMRIVRTSAELAGAVEAARREALAAFGDGTVFCERYVEGGRHVEVQVFGDAHGTVVALGERECSIQRRHQKIVEEAPSPAVGPDLRAVLFDAAVTAARAVGYVGAGTVEFLLASDGTFSFLEMNTRLQVEHPVTECVLDLDLVRLQILVAEGHPLPFAEPPPMRGHAIEARLYAEDVAHGWRPSTGTLHRFAMLASEASGSVAVPDRAGLFAVPDMAGLRVDSGVCDGSAVTVHYDPMLAKLIAWAPTRDEAARALSAALARAEIHGVVTNRDLLVRVLRSNDFLAGATDTGFLDRHPEVFAPLLESGHRPLACLAAALAQAGAEAGPEGAGAGAGTSAWGGLPVGWRNVPSLPQVTAFDAPWGRVEVRYSYDRAGRVREWSVDGEPGRATVVRLSPGEVVLDDAGLVVALRVRTVDGISYIDSPYGSVALAAVPRFAPPVTERPAGSLLAPMPGTVGAVAVEVGQRVVAGDLLLTLEAMKLEHPVQAPEAGVVAELHVAAGDQVEAGTALAVITVADA